MQFLAEAAVSVRIAYLTADFGVPVLGTKGASAHVRGLVQAFRAEGHDISVLAANIGDDAPVSFTVQEVPFIGAFPILYEALQQEEVCLGTRLSKDLRNLLYASNLELQGRLILKEFLPELIYERHCLFSTAGLALARYFKIPLLLEVNAPLVVEHEKMRGLSLPFVARAAERLVLTSADHVVVVSQALREHAVRTGVATDRVSVIPNAADPDMFDPAAATSPVREQLGWRDRFVIGFVGSMKPWHGVETLLDALHLLGGSNSPFRLLLVGSGPQLPELRERSERLGLAGAVHMMGAVPHDTVPGLLGAMDVTVAAYAAGAAQYFSPVKLFEYMAMALPVVAARVGQVCDVIDERRTGWLYTPGDAGDLAGIIRALECDRDLCRTVGAAARQRVMNEYTWRHNARRVIGIAEDLVAKGRAADRSANARSATHIPDSIQAVVRRRHVSASRRSPALVEASQPKGIRGRQR